MKIKYEIEQGLCSTICPFKRTSEHMNDWTGDLQRSAIKVGSYSCQNDCPHNKGKDDKEQWIECSAGDDRHEKR